MIGLQPGHIVVIVLIAVLIFAPTRLYKLVRGFKSMFAQFRGEVSNQEKNKNASAGTQKRPES
jgi:Sec-independent protein translocase protein TatA